MTDFTLSTLPAPLLTRFLQLQTASAAALKAHRSKLSPTAVSIIEPTVSSAIWATDNYEELGHGFSTTIADTVAQKGQEALELIVPRKDKAKAIQKKRTKDKAEVFTPSWVCNLQNNLADDHSIREGAFNRTEDDGKSWIPSDGAVFENLEEAVGYITSPRLEITCGEAPYLVSRYDTVTGEDLPVRDGQSRFQRIGLLDRKLRVVAETAGSSWELWQLLAKEALKATYGYEWQGDSLLLARLNLLNSYLDYRRDYLVSQGYEESSASEAELLEVADIICWNIWQMDGLKMVLPLSCSDRCVRCDSSRLKESHQKYYGHDGVVPLIRFRGDTIPFEDMVYYSTGANGGQAVAARKEDKPSPLAGFFG